MHACTTWNRLLADENGMESLEFAMIVGLVIAGMLIALAAIGLWVASIYVRTLTLVGA